MPPVQVLQKGQKRGSSRGTKSNRKWHKERFIQKIQKIPFCNLKFNLDYLKNKSDANQVRHAGKTVERAARQLRRRNPSKLPLNLR